MTESRPWEARLAEDPRRVVVLDDDPTGTQTVADVDVILRPSRDAFRQFITGSDRAVYIMTNSRALPVEQAATLIRHIRDDVDQVSAETGTPVAFVLRGDSTLRGHVFAEVDTLMEPDAVILFVPAFPEGGRVTVGGIQLITVGNERLPVAQTEFARDPVFGYRSEQLVDWVREVGDGRPAITLPLVELREKGPGTVTDALLGAPAGTVIIPDAETAEDLRQIAWGLLDAEAQGRRVVVRSASTFAAVRAGLHGRIVSRAAAQDERPLLVVCGSHVAASSRQLQRLLDRLPAPPAVVGVDRLIQEGQERVVSELARQLRQDLATRGIAVLATERHRQARHSDLATGAQVMGALVAVVSRIADDLGAVIAKGGITAAQVARDGLGAGRARVRGQLEPGVSLWDLDRGDGRHTPYAVIPGNVGHDGTLVNVADAFDAPLQAVRPRLQPIEQRSMVTEITQRLLDYLLSGALRPGDRLPSERQLAEALGTGRSTLRESLKALTVLGLLDVRQGDGTYLKQRDSNLLPRVIEWGLLLGEQRTMDVVEARRKLEVVIAELAAQRRTAIGVDALRDIVQRMAAATARAEVFADADVAFHLQVAELAGNQVLQDILRSIRALLRALTIRTIGGDDPEGNQIRYEAYLEHVPIFEAIKQGDPEAAAAAMEAHMEAGAKRLMQVVASAPDILFGVGELRYTETGIAG